MASWTRVIETHEDVPAIYKKCFQPQTAEKRPFPYTVLAPAIVKPHGRTSEKLVFDQADAIHIAEQSDGQVVAKGYPYRTISMLEMGCILLDSWITLSGPTEAGVVDTSTIDFNTSGTRHYAAFLERIRPPLPGADEAHLRVEKDKFHGLSTVNYKFMNYGRSSLAGGETVRQIVYQPEIRQPTWSLLGDLFQTIVTPAHLTILTDRELILIQDVPSVKKTQKTNHGGIWHYIRLDSIRSVSRAETNGRLTLSIAVSPDRKLERTFATSCREELGRLYANF